MRVSLPLLAAIAFCLAGPVLADIPDVVNPNVKFPEPPSFTSSEDAEKAFKERAKRVIAMSACGREMEYVQRRDYILKQKFDKAGPEFTEILVAKIGWLNDPELRQQACEAPGPFIISGSDINLWNDPSRPTNCQSLLSAAINETNKKETVSILVKVTPECMRRQVNDAISAMEKYAQMGTNGLFCLLSTKGVRAGEFDVIVRQVTRFLYMGRIGSNPVLDRSTIDHMYRSLLAARGELSDADYSQIAGCDDPAGDDLGSPEDWADQEKWYNELLSNLGDVFSWPLEFYLKAMATVYLGVADLYSAPLLLVAGESPSYPVFDIRLPETENHRLMIESSKYLTNNAMLRELEAVGYDKGSVDAKKAEQKQVREWLLGQLKKFTINDFDEYNSRPYTDFSLESILNLYDFSNLEGFSDDKEMCTASAIVLDLSAAKFVAGSNRGRRIAPYRRRTYYDGTAADHTAPRNLYNMTDGADHEVVRALLLAGQTQLLPDGVPAPLTGGAVNTAVSDYRLPDALFEIVADRDSTSTAYPFSQSIRHAGIESYYASRAFTMSYGGIRTPAALNFYGTELFNHSDRGIAMPISIVPTIAGSNATDAGSRTTDDVFSFLGDGTEDRRSENLCGWQGFICGISPHKSDSFRNCTSPDSSPDESGAIYFFVNSADCLPTVAGPHFYLAAKRAPCPDTFCKKGLLYGLMEITESPAEIDVSSPSAAKGSKEQIDEKFDTFKADRKEALSASVPDKEGNGIYITATGDHINYQIKQDHSHISSVNGASKPQFSSSSGFLTQGDIINSEGNGKIHIMNPSKGGGEILAIDFTDALHPQLSPNDCKCEKEPLPIRCQKQPPINIGPVVQPPGPVVQPPGSVVH
jgi:hypothetical protein